MAKYDAIESETLEQMPSKEKNKQKVKDDGLNKDITKAATIKVSGSNGYSQKKLLLTIY